MEVAEKLNPAYSEMFLQERAHEVVLSTNIRVSGFLLEMNMKHRNGGSCRFVFAEELR